LAEQTKNFYAKFRLDQGPLRILDAFLISEDKDRVERWKADKAPEEEDTTTPTRPTLPNTFEDIAASFEKAINSFQNTVPFIMRMIPFLLRTMDDRSLREFARGRGDRLEEGEFETYRLSIEHLGEVTRRIERANSIRSGVDSLPNMFFVGLVSAYDKFLSDIIRAIFIVRPEFLSSSERNLSFTSLSG
jgi:hypothetical protein